MWLGGGGKQEGKNQKVNLTLSQNIHQWGGFFFFFGGGGIFLIIWRQSSFHKTFGLCWFIQSNYGSEQRTREGTEKGNISRGLNACVSKGGGGGWEGGGYGHEGRVGFVV